MNNRLHWFPLEPADILTKDEFARLSNEHFGAVVRIVHREAHRVNSRKTIAVHRVLQSGMCCVSKIPVPLRGACALVEEVNIVYLTTCDAYKCRNIDSQI